MKTIQRAFGFLLAATLMTTSFVGCAQEVKPSESESTSSGTSDSNYTVGYNYFGSGSYALLSLANNSQIVIDAFGNKSIAMDDEFSIEKIVQDIENMISSGVDGLIVWLPAESMYTTIADMCAKAKIPFVLNDKIPSDESIIAALKANPYFVGAVSPANAVYGQRIAEYALERGFMTCITASAGVGDPSDAPRLEAFTEAYIAGGGKIFTDLHADNADSAQGQIEDALIANPDVDFVYGVGSDYGIAACSALENMGIDARVLTSGLDSGALDLLKDGRYMEMVNGDFWVCGMLSAVVLQNYLDGTPLKDGDGNAVWIDNVMPFEVSVDKIDLYNRFFIDEYCYSNEEIKQMSGKYNADFEYNAFLKIIEEYNLENRLRAKYEAGKVTDEELSVVGITVN